MKIIKADFILTCKNDFEIIKDGAIAFEKSIIEYGKAKDIEEKYPNFEQIQTPKNSVIMPGLVNPHVHLEFSSNTTTLEYGDFILWLNSVIKNRDEVIEKSTHEKIEAQLQIMKKSGTTSLGAISSYGNDFEACKNAAQRVVFFTEILGSRPDSVDILFEDFKSRLRHTEENSDEFLIPAISVHSPYSTHPILAKNALDIARKRDYVVSTHFMESVAEREWLDNSKGDFCNFFSNFAPNAKPMSDASSFIQLFHGCKTLFTHCVQANKNEIQMIQNMNASITHCPVSNRFLNTGRLQIEHIENEFLSLGTDGLSSNISLNLWDEMRAALMLHHKADLNKLATLLIKMATINSAKALNLNCGVIEKDRFADFLVCTFDDTINLTQDLALQLILHVKNPNQVYIAGEKS